MGYFKDADILPGSPFGKGGAGSSPPVAADSPSKRGRRKGRTKRQTVQAEDTKEQQQHLSPKLQRLYSKAAAAAGLAVVGWATAIGR